MRGAGAKNGYDGSRPKYRACGARPKSRKQKSEDRNGTEAQKGAGSAKKERILACSSKRQVCVLATTHRKEINRAPIRQGGNAAQRNGCGMLLFRASDSAARGREEGKFARPTARSPGPNEC